MVWAVAMVVIFIAAPSLGWWFPGTGEALSHIGEKIDLLFYVVLAITGIVFIGTQAALGYVLWKGATRRPEERAHHFHGSHLLEILWTIIPGFVLLFIAIFQMNVWAEFRIRSYAPEDIEPIAEVTARQFEWRIRYPAPGKRLMPQPQPDDVYTVNELHVPVNRQVSISLRSEDVQHAFFVPMLRIKQDALPGAVIPIWFDVTKPGTYDLVCAELCGWGHYKMLGRVIAEEDATFRQWKEIAAAHQADDGTPPGTKKPEAEPPGDGEPKTDAAATTPADASESEK